jgi:hypothetical protein
MADGCAAAVTVLLLPDGAAEGNQGYVFFYN